MNRISHFAYIGIIIFLVSTLLVTLSRPPKVVEHKVCQTDTLTITKIDTLFITKKEIVEKETVVYDTIYVDDTPIPMTRYRFFDNGKYDIYALGYNVSLESIKVFPKTEYKYITNTIETIIKEEPKYDFFLGGGFEVFNNTFIPQVSLGLETPKNTLILANIGYYDGQLTLGGKMLWSIRNKR